VHCVEAAGRRGWRVVACGVVLVCSLAGCESLRPGESAPTQAPQPGTGTRVPTPGDTGKAPRAPGGGDARGSKGDERIVLAAPRKPRSLKDLREQAAQRLVAANPRITYTSRPPDILLAIPVLTVELNADGSVRRIEVMRHPRQARDTVDIAIQAVRRAAPFGDVSGLPKPWKFNETFLFNNQRHFKPMTLDR